MQELVRNFLRFVIFIFGYIKAFTGGHRPYYAEGIEEGQQVGKLSLMMTMILTKL